MMGLFGKQEDAADGDAQQMPVFEDQQHRLVVTEEDGYLHAVWSDWQGDHDVWRYLSDKPFLRDGFWDAEDYLALLRGHELRLAYPTAEEIQEHLDEFEQVYVDTVYGALVYQDWQRRAYLIVQEGIAKPEPVAYEMSLVQLKALTQGALDISVIHRDLKHGRTM